jgi:hypothetical protein
MWARGPVIEGQAVIAADDGFVDRVDALGLAAALGELEQRRLPAARVAAKATEQQAWDVVLSLAAHHYMTLPARPAEPRAAAGGMGRQQRPTRYCVGCALTVSACNMSAGTA